MEYSLFLSPSKVLLTRLEDSYLRYYSKKKEYVDARQVFMQELAEKYPHVCKEDDNKDDEKAKSTELQENKKRDLTPSSPLAENQSEDTRNVKKEELPFREFQPEDQSKELLGAHIYHKLVLHLHPDKNKKINPVFFQLVKESYERGKFPKLCFFAKHFNIGVDDIEFTEEEEKMIEEIMDKKKRKIDQKHNTYPMVYKRASVHEKKNILANFSRL